MLLLLLGPPGAGKGTQGALLAARLGVPQLATGDVLRAAVREGTPQGRAAKGYMDRGDLVPDEIILGIMKETLAKPDAAKGVVLDGVVRTVPQAEGLARVLRELGRSLDAVLVFNVEDEELVRRLGGRTICESCQTPYMGRELGSKCERCGGKLVRRKDDEPEAIRNRLRVFQEQTAPVLQWYRSHEEGGARVLHINALGTVDLVTQRVKKALES
jgi:adenylate kinase